MSGFRAERIGLTNAARLLGVPVTELKEAIRREELLRGVNPPRPLVRSVEYRGNMLFLAGDVMDCAEALKKQGSAC